MVYKLHSYFVIIAFSWLLTIEGVFLFSFFSCPSTQLSFVLHTSIYLRFIKKKYQSSYPLSGMMFYRLSQLDEYSVYERCPVLFVCRFPRPFGWVEEYSVSYHNRWMWGPLFSNNQFPTYGFTLSCPKKTRIVNVRHENPWINPGN